MSGNSEVAGALRAYFRVDRGKGLPAGTESYEAFLTEAGDDPAYPDLEEDDAAAMCYTSGTTGRPRVSSIHTGPLRSIRSRSSMPDHFTSSPITLFFLLSPCTRQCLGFALSAVMNGSKLVLPVETSSALPCLT